jgi:hypothetical protein
MCPFNPWQHAMRYRDATTRSASQTLECTQTYIFRVENVFNAKVHYQQTLSSAIHHTSNVRLLQENVTPSCNLPKQSTFPWLLYLNSQIRTTSTQDNDAPTPTVQDFHAHNIFRCSTRKYCRLLLYGLESPWKRNITAPQAAALSLDSRRSSVARSWW